jgi:hypothetical protein
VRGLRSLRDIQLLWQHNFREFLWSPGVLLFRQCVQQRVLIAGVYAVARVKQGMSCQRGVREQLWNSRWR